MLAISAPRPVLVLWCWAMLVHSLHKLALILKFVLEKATQVCAF